MQSPDVSKTFIGKRMLKKLCFIIIGLLCFHNVFLAAGRGSEIVSWLQAKEGEFPFVVSLQTNARKHFCVGSLVTLSFILTACNCFNQFLENGVHRSNFTFKSVAVGGSVDITSGGNNQVRYIRYMITHTSCTQLTFGMQNDYGLCQTMEPFEAGPKLDVMRVFSLNKNKLQEKTDALIENRTICQLLSWGAQNHSLNGNYSNNSDVLMKLNIYLVHNRICSLELCAIRKVVNCRDDYIFDQGQFCAYGCNRVNACKSKAGEPIYCNGYVYGFASGRFRCRDTFSTTIFSRLDYGLDFFTYGHSDPYTKSKCSIVKSSMSLLPLLTISNILHEK